MAREEIDLTGTNYDALETEMSKYLGVKVILVRGWSDGGMLNSADTKLQLARTKEAWEEARKEYITAKEAVVSSLRGSIWGRDPAVADALSDTDIYALKQKGHVTLRKGNSEPEQAVIIFDPFDAPARNVATLAFSDASGGNKTVVNLTEGGPAKEGRDEKEAAIAIALAPRFDNLWDREERGRIAVSGLVENFDISLDDLRRYKAYVNVRYALANQSEYAHQGGRDMPRYLQFAGIVNTGLQDMHTPQDRLSLRQVYKAIRLMRDSFDAEEMGFKDKDFFEKLKLADAAMNITNGAILLPNNTFARLNSSHEANDTVVRESMDDLRKRLKDKVKEKFPDSFDFSVMQDWRAIFPIFREVYEADKSEGVKREYLDTVMQGLQKYFPTITNAPVPTDSKENEPPRTLPKSGSAPKAPKPAGM